MKAASLTTLVCLLSMQVAVSESLYTQKGTDAPFVELMNGGKLPKGHNSKEGVTGSVINVNHKLVEEYMQGRKARAISVGACISAKAPSNTMR